MVSRATAAGGICLAAVPAPPGTASGDESSEVTICSIASRCASHSRAPAHHATKSQASGRLGEYPLQGSCQARLVDLPEIPLNTVHQHHRDLLGEAFPESGVVVYRLLGPSDSER